MTADEGPSGRASCRSAASFDVPCEEAAGGLAAAILADKSGRVTGTVMHTVDGGHRLV